MAANLEDQLIDKVRALPPTNNWQRSDSLSAIEYFKLAVGKIVGPSVAVIAVLYSEDALDGGLVGFAELEPRDLVFHGNLGDQLRRRSTAPERQDYE